MSCIPIDGEDAELLSADKCGLAIRRPRVCETQSSCHDMLAANWFSSVDIGVRTDVDALDGSNMDASKAVRFYRIECELDWVSTKVYQR